MQDQPQLKGVVTELITRALDGARIGSKLIFQPSQNWYMIGDHDYLGEIEYTDPEEFCNEFGTQALEKVMCGEIVPVIAKQPNELNLSFSGGPIRNFKKITSRIIYPIKGTSEILVLV